MSNKPREFWVCSWDGFEHTAFDSKPEKTPTIHVIEFSAYEELKHLLESINKHVLPSETDSIESMKAILKERDEYRAALEQIKHDGRLTIMSHSEEYMDGAHDGHLRQAETADEVLAKYPKESK